MTLTQSRASKIPSRIPLVIQAQASSSGTLKPLQPETGLWYCRTSSAMIRLSKRTGRKVKNQGNMWVQEGEYSKEKKCEGDR